MHQVEKKVYNISNIGWIYAPFLEKGAYINELPAILRPTVLKEKSYICRHKNLSKTKCKK
jgi:hypothetical protein